MHYLHVSGCIIPKTCKHLKQTIIRPIYDFNLINSVCRMKVIPAVKSDLMKSSGSRHYCCAHKVLSYTVRHSLMIRTTKIIFREQTLCVSVLYLHVSFNDSGAKTTQTQCTQINDAADANNSLRISPSVTEFTWRVQVLFLV